MRRGK